MAEQGELRARTAVAPRRRHRAVKDELSRIAAMRRAAAAARGAKPRKPGGRYHAPEGRRARLRKNTNVLRGVQAIRR